MQLHCLISYPCTKSFPQSLWIKTSPIHPCVKHSHELVDPMDMLQPETQVFKFIFYTVFKCLLPQQELLDGLPTSVQNYQAATVCLIKIVKKKTVSKDLNNQIFNFALAQDDDTSQNVMKCPLAVLHLSKFYNILRSIIILGPGKVKYCSLLIILTFRNRVFFTILIRHTVAAW